MRPPRQEAGQQKAWLRKLWIYDLRNNKSFTLKTNPLKREDLNEFVDVFKPGAAQNRKPTWTRRSPTAALRAPRAQGEVRPTENGSLRKGSRMEAAT